MFVLAHGQSVQPFLAQTRTTFLGESQGDLSRRKPGQVSVKKMVFFHIQRAKHHCTARLFPKKKRANPRRTSFFKPKNCILKKPTCSQRKIQRVATIYNCSCKGHGNNQKILWFDVWAVWGFNSCEKWGNGSGWMVVSHMISCQLCGWLQPKSLQLGPFFDFWFRFTTLVLLKHQSDWKQLKNNAGYWKRILWYSDTSTVKLYIAVMICDMWHVCIPAPAGKFCNERKGEG